MKQFKNLIPRVEVDATIPGRVFDCDECNDSGLVQAQEGYVFETPGWRDSSGRVNIVRGVVSRLPDGSLYPNISIPCLACKPLRDHKQKIQYQAMSELTDDEREYNLSSIILTASRHDTKEMVAAANEMLNGQANMITVYGQTGNAKSLLLIAMVNEFLDRGIPALYVRTSDMLDWIRDAYNADSSPKEGGGSALDRLDMLKGILFLAIDEFGAVKRTDWVAEKLDSLIDRRYRDAIAQTHFTMIAMNEHPEISGDRIFSRLRDKRLRVNGSPIIQNQDSDVRRTIERR